MKPTARTCIHLTCVVFFYCAFFSVFFGSVLFSDNFIQSDGLLPAFYAPIQSWTDRLFSGYPILAAPEWQTLYPPRLLFSILPAKHSFNVFILFAFVLAGSFTYGYVYALTKCRPAALLSGVMFALSGFMVAHLGHSSMIHAAVWLPLIIWATEKLRQGFSRLWFSLATLAVSMCILAGHPQIFVYAMIVTLAYSLFLGPTAKIKWQIFIIVTVAFVTLGCGLAATQILPTLELAHYSVRAAISYEDFMSFSLPASQIVQLLFPYIFGALEESPYGLGYFGAWNQTELTGYVGLSTLMLASIGLVTNYRNRIVLFWTATGIVAFLWALGDATPVAKVVYHFPIVNKFRAQGRLLLLLAFASSILAAYAVQAFHALIIPVRPVILVILSWTAVLASSFTYIAVAYKQLVTLAADKKISLPPIHANLSIWVPLGVFVISAIALMALRARLRCRLPVALLLLVVVIDLGSFAGFYQWRYWTTPKQYILATPSYATGYIDLLKKSHQRLAPMAGCYSKLFPPNDSKLHGIASASGYGPLLIKRYSSIMQIDGTGQMEPGLLDEQNRALDMMAVRYIIPPKYLPENYNNKLYHGGRWQHVEDVEGTSIFENTNCMPRAWLVWRVIYAEKDDILKAIHTSRLPDGSCYAPQEMALIEDQLKLETGAPDSKAVVEIIQQNDTLTEIKTISESAAFLVLSDIYYPGWQATLDGENVRILRANYVLRGLMLPAGEHIVRVEFKPQSVIAGALVSVISLFLMIMLLQCAHRVTANTSDKE